MGQYLKIGTSPADLIAHAQGMQAKGESLQADLGGLLSDIASRETPKVLTNDEFGKPFQSETYHKDVPSAHGHSYLSEATKDGAKSVADTAVRYGNGVTQAMVDYISVDGENQADIGASVK
jgi:hypothetical protein